MDFSVRCCLSFLLLYGVVSSAVVGHSTGNNDGGGDSPVTDTDVAELRTELENLRAAVAEMANEREYTNPVSSRAYH